MATDYTIREDASPVPSSDVYYDLFDGGYLNPENFLKNDTAIMEVRAAMSVINTYLAELEDAGILEAL